jgi:hypothetical protein
MEGIHMRRHVILNVLFAAAISAALAAGCDDSEGAGKTALSAMIPDPVELTVGLINGKMTFDFSAHPLDMERLEDLTYFLYTGGIGVTVANDETGVTHNLNDGTNVASSPDQVGEFLVAASEDGAIVTVEFYNWFQGASIRADGDYSATVEVLENEFFVTETFVRQVTVVP